MKQCIYCGFAVDESLKLCPNCKAPLLHKKTSDESGPQIPINQSTATETPTPSPKKKKKKLPIIIAVVVFLIFALSMCSGGSSDESEFEEIYNSYLSSEYAEVASDGSYLSIDTNPNDIEDYTVDGAIEGIIIALDELGIPESVLQKMGETSSLDGRLTEEHNGIEISWKYHPDNGLEVLFVKN